MLTDGHGPQGKAPWELSKSGEPRCGAPISRVVVTGASGFLGGHVCERLVQSGSVVVGVDRRDPQHDPTAAVNLPGVVRDKTNFVFVAADLVTDPLESVLAQADVVVHLAGRPGVRPSWGEGFREYAKDNLVATQRVMEAGMRVEIPRIVLASSSSVYGPTHGRAAVETLPTVPVSPYGASKLAAESVGLAYAAHPAGPSVAALRYFTLYGPRQREDMFIAKVLTAACEGGEVQLYGSGQHRDFTYVADAVEATVAATRVEDTGVFNIGGGNAVSLSEVLCRAEEVTGTTIRTRPAPVQPGDVPATLADHGRARAVFGWRPRTDLTHGLQQHWQWLTSTALRRGSNVLAS